MANKSPGGVVAKAMRAASRPSEGSGKPKKVGKPARDKTAEAKLAKYPRHSVERSLRIPGAILKNNAGKDCTGQESAKFCGAKYTAAFELEISSSIKYGFLRRPAAGRLSVTDRAKQVIRPKEPTDRLEALRVAVLEAPVLGEVYQHYRGENLPADEFFYNTLAENFGILTEKIPEFTTVFFESLKSAGLIEDRDGTKRIVDFTHGATSVPGSTEAFKKLEKSVSLKSGDSCFVMMPFAAPLGAYYEKIYKPAIEKAGLIPVRADNDIFGVGKIIDQIATGIKAARVLIAELTQRNANVFYELGLAHALQKPVVLVSSNDGDVPFDLRHIRVIYYDMTDPFWGNKLMDKIAENILSAIDHPEEAVLKALL